MPFQISSSADCSGFMNTIWAVATTHARGLNIRFADDRTKNDGIVPASRGYGSDGLMSYSTTNMMKGTNGAGRAWIELGFTNLGQSQILLQPGDITVNPGADANGHTTMIVEPLDGNWYWDGNQKYFYVVHCSPLNTRDNTVFYNNIPQYDTAVAISAYNINQGNYILRYTHEL